MLSDVVDCMDLAGVGKDARRRIVNDSIVLPAIPEPRDDIQVFPGALVTLAMRRMFGQAEILCRLRRGRGDDVPAGAAVAIRPIRFVATAIAESRVIGSIRKRWA